MIILPGDYINVQDDDFLYVKPRHPAVLKEGTRFREVVCVNLVESLVSTRMFKEIPHKGPSSMTYLRRHEALDDIKKLKQFYTKMLTKVDNCSITYYN